MLRGRQTVHHVKCPKQLFIHCWDAVFIWNVLQRTLKKDIGITTYTIPFLPVSSKNTFSFDLVMPVALYSMRKPRLDIRNENLYLNIVRIHFIDLVSRIKSVYDIQELVPEWSPLFSSLTDIKQF